MAKAKNDLYRVRFQSKDDRKPFEVVVRSVASSDFMGLVTLEGFVFNDQTKHVVLPEEDEARKRFSKVKRLHIPYHHILLIEEFAQEEADLKNLPFIKEVPSEDAPAAEAAQTSTAAFRRFPFAEPEH